MVGEWLSEIMAWHGTTQKHIPVHIHVYRLGVVLAYSCNLIPFSVHEKMHGHCCICIYRNGEAAWKGAFFMLGLGAEESFPLIHLRTARLATVKISLFQIQK